MSCDQGYTPISGATVKRYKPTKAGRYAVRITSAFCDDTSECVYVSTPDICIGQPNTALARTDTTILCMEGNASSYQWLYCDSNYKPIPQATGRFYKPKFSARYACLLSKDDCSDTTDCYYFEVPRLGIIDNNSSDIRVYPNPTKDFVHIAIPNAMRNLNITLYNVLGQEMAVQARHDGKGGEWIMDVSHLYKGVYTLKIKNDEGEVLQIERLVITK